MMGIRGDRAGIGRHGTSHRVISPTSGTATWRDRHPFGQHLTMETTRVDRFVWAVRLYPTRSAATAACQGGHVEVNGRGAKPSTPVRIGDRVEATVGGRARILEVARVIDK